MNSSRSHSTRLHHPVMLWEGKGGAERQTASRDGVWRVCRQRPKQELKSTLNPAAVQCLGQERGLKIFGETFFEVVSPLYGCNKAGKRKGGDALTAG